MIRALLAAALVIFAALPAFASTLPVPEGASLPWICVAQPGTRGTTVHLVLADIDAARVQDGDLVLINGQASPALHLSYFVAVTADSMAWGARNTRTGSTYYRYEMDRTSGALSYRAGGEAARPGGTCLHPTP